MDAVYEEINRDLLHFIAKAPSVFHAVSSIRTALSYAGFTEIREEDPWQIERGGKYVVTRNGSALMAFTIPEDGGHAFRITASHGDSPSFKIKENPELRDAAYVRLNVEGYGGMIMSTWLGAIGILVYEQGFGFIQIYTAPFYMALPAVSAILIGGASVNKASIANVIIGTFLFQGIVTMTPTVMNSMIHMDMSEVIRIIISNGMILYALTRKTEGSK